MFCENCGKKRIADEAFCESCGHPFPMIEKKDSSISEEINEPKIEQLEAVVKQEIPTLEKRGDITINGSEIQWMYEFSFWRNPAILITSAKVMLIALFVPTVFMFFISLSDGFMDAIRLSATIFAYGVIGMAVLLIIAYVFVGFLYGGKYYVLFKMDDKGVNHIQLDKQYKKAQALGYLSALIGLSSGNLTTAGSGLMAATKQSLYTSFKKVKSIKVAKARNTIYVNETLSRNQVYVSNEDFDFVLEHILNNCPKNVRVTNK